jgi:hypothetical protein
MFVTQDLSPIPIEAERRSLAPAPEPRWISKGSTLNPSPGRLLKERRDTAEGCHDRAAADLLEAATMTTAQGRQMLEKSAASWNARAELLQRMEESGRDAIKLTDAELAEDAAHLRQCSVDAADVNRGGSELETRASRRPDNRDERT